MNDTITIRLSPEARAWLEATAKSYGGNPPVLPEHVAAGIIERTAQREAATQREREQERERRKSS